MPIKILALVPEAISARGCLDVAWAAALAVGADVEAFHVRVDPKKLVTADEERSVQWLRVRNEGTAEQRAQAVRAIYAAWREDHHLAPIDRVTWTEVVAAEEAAAVQESRHVDLVVVPRAHNLDGGDAHHAAFRLSHRPLLFVPDHVADAATRFAKNVAIAWKSTPQAHRAVEGAAAWLRLADRVNVVMAATTPEQGGWEELERLARQLGFSPHPVLVNAGGSTVGEAILNAVQNLQADVGVMGAYRHNDLVEWALPSTTRFVLGHADVPLFMAH